MDAELLKNLNLERVARHAVIVAADLESGHHTLIRSGDDLQSLPYGEEVSRRFLSGKSGLVTLADDSQIFLRVYLPLPRLVLIGAVHISQALVPMAQIAGFDVQVIDPRTAFASDARFPAEILSDEWPEDALARTPLDAYTAVAVITHDPKIDDFPLIEALKTNCFYVGALGSRKTHAKRIDRLFAAGLTQAQIDRIDAPIGLDIGSATPGEIAVSILGQVIMSLRKPMVAE